MVGTAGVMGTAGASGAGGMGTGGTMGTAGDTSSGADGAAGAGMGGSGGGTAGTGTPPLLMDVLGVKNMYQNFIADSFILFPCYRNQNQDCITNKAGGFGGAACPGNKPGLPFEEQGEVIDQDFKVGGVSGKMYKVTIQVNGISEGKYYMGGTRAAGEGAPPNADSPSGSDTFYTGGAPVAAEFYNVYSIRSKDTTGKEMQHYYLNSFPMVATRYETHTTFAISYKHDIVVMGGGTVTYHSSDINCHAIDNCGSGYRTVTCAVGDGRMVPNEPNLVVPTTYLGQQVSDMNARNGAAQPFHSHIIHITATAIAAM